MLRSIRKDKRAISDFLFGRSTTYILVKASIII